MASAGFKHEDLRVGSFVRRAVRGSPDDSPPKMIVSYSLRLLVIPTAIADRNYGWLSYEIGLNQEVPLRKQSGLCRV